MVAQEALLAAPAVRRGDEGGLVGPDAACRRPGRVAAVGTHVEARVAAAQHRRRPLGDAGARAHHGDALTEELGVREVLLEEVGAPDAHGVAMPAPAQGTDEADAVRHDERGGLEQRGEVGLAQRAHEDLGVERDHERRRLGARPGEVDERRNSGVHVDDVDRAPEDARARGGRHRRRH